MERKSGQKYLMLKDCFCEHFKKGDVLTLDEKCSDNNIIWFCVEKNKWGTGCVINFDNDLCELVETQNFQLGDVVEAFGLKGVVDNITDTIYPIQVLWENNASDTFTREGKLDTHHKEPSLKLLERPVKEVSFECELKSNTGNNYVSIHSHDLNQFIGKEVVVTVKLKA